MTAGSKAVTASCGGDMAALAVEFITLGGGTRGLASRARGHRGTRDDRLRGGGGRASARGRRSRCGTWDLAAVTATKGAVAAFTANADHRVVAATRSRRHGVFTTARPAAHGEAAGAHTRHKTRQWL